MTSLHRNVCNDVAKIWLIMVLVVVWLLYNISWETLMMIMMCVIYLSGESADVMAAE